MKTGNKRLVTGILGKIILLGFAAQIVFGLTYAVRNLTYIPMFGETAKNVYTSGTFVCDTYTGVLYPAVILLFRLLSAALKFPWQSAVYLLQITLMVFAGTKFLAAFGKNKSEEDRYPRYMYIFGGFTIATFPFLMQVNMAVLSASMALSFFLLELAFFRDSFESLALCSGRLFSIEIGRVCLFWMLAALTEWKYLIIGALPVIVISVKAFKYIRRIDSKSIKYPIFIILSFVVITLGVYSLTADRSNPSLPKRGVAVSLFDRVAWREISEAGNIRFYVLQIIGEDNIEKVIAEREAVKTLAEPIIETKLGRKEANRFYLSIVKETLQTSLGELFHDMRADFAGYLAAPLIVRKLLSESSFLSYTIRNYDIFTRNAPVLSKYYMDYSLFWFATSLVIAAVLLLLRAIAYFSVKKEDRDKAIEAKWKAEGKIYLQAKKRGPSKPVIVIMILGVILAIAGTFRGSCVYDYKEAGFTTVLWLTLILFSIDGVAENELS